jgi:hypothetical protein
MIFSFGCPSCECALRCVGVPNLRTCLALHWGAQLANVPCVADVPCVCIEDVRWGTQLADVPCIALGRPTCERALCCGRALCLHCGRSLGCPTCGRALLCIGAPNLRMCLALRWGTQLGNVPYVVFGNPSCGRALHCVGAPNLGESILKGLPPSQNLFLTILQLVF